MSTGYLSPIETAEQMTEIGRNKSKMPIFSMTILGILAGVYIAFGAELSTMVTHDFPQYLGVGASRFVAGSVFSIGLMLVVFCGAELFTGNCMMITSVLAKRVRTVSMLSNWVIIFCANFAGALILAGLVYFSGIWKLGGYGVGTAALTTAVSKVELTFVEAFTRGIACNWLVCLAVWMAVAGRDTLSKVAGIYFPVTAFVASGFEHSIANMYFIPIGIFLKSNPFIVEAAGYINVSALTWNTFLAANLLPVTLGNIVGGALFVGGAYYLAYLRTSKTAVS